MNILHVCQSMAPEWGGPPRAIVGIIDSTSSDKFVNTIATVRRQNHSPEIKSSAALHSFPELPLVAKIWPSFSVSATLKLKALILEADVVHVHELWHQIGAMASWYAKKLRKPLVISPHGSLTTRAFEDGAFKKRLYWNLIQSSMFRRAHAVHVFSSEERERFQAFGIPIDCHLIPNGVEPSPRIPESEAAEYKLRLGYTKSDTIAVFLGRIHPLKNLELLIKSVSDVNHRTPHQNLYLLLAGPIDEAYKNQLIDVANDLGITNRLKFTGMIGRAERDLVFSISNLYVQSSHSEGSSMALREAAAAGLPIVATESCNFAEAERFGLGISVESSVIKFSDAIVKVLADPNYSAGLSETAVENYLKSESWTALANDYTKMYESVLNTQNRRG